MSLLKNPEMRANSTAIRQGSPTGKDHGKRSRIPVSGDIMGIRLRAARLLLPLASGTCSRWVAIPLVLSLPFSFTRNSWEANDGVGPSAEPASENGMNRTSPSQKPDRTRCQANNPARRRPTATTTLNAQAPRRALMAQREYL
jgi:hypothetical protein